MTKDFMDRRINDHANFYCPAGHPQHYNGPSKEEQLRQELARNKEMLGSANSRAARLGLENAAITKAHQKMRTRVMNGVCPCCNRSFANLRSHMQSEHSDFGDTKTLHALRTAFGMTQADVAKEAGVDSTHVSLYERDKPVAAYVKRRLDLWTESQQAKA